MRLRPTPELLRKKRIAAQRDHGLDAEICPKHGKIQPVQLGDIHVCPFRDCTELTGSSAVQALDDAIKRNAF